MPLVRAVANKVIAVLLVVMGVICTVTAVGQYVQGQRFADQREKSAAFTHCTAEWQADFLIAYEARSSAGIVVSDAMDRLVRAVADQDPHAFRAALKHYLAVRDRQNEERAKNPLPPLPQVRCGG